MAVISIEPAPDTMAGTWNRTWQRTYTLKWVVHCDSVLDGPVTIRLALDGAGHQWLPFIGTYYNVSSAEKDLGAFVTDVSYEPVAVTALGADAFGNPLTGREWMVTYQYGPYDGGAFGTDPTSWPVLVSFEQEQYQRVVLVDQAGVPILNSARCPYEDPVQVDDSRSVITVVRREAVGGTSPFDLAKAETYRNTVNSATWNGFAAKTVMCSSISTGQQEYDSNNRVYFFTVTYVFHVNRDTWTRSILDQGFQVLGTDSQPTPLLAADGDRIDEPVLLNGSGAELGVGGTPVFRSHEVYPAVDFSAFAIDFSLALGR